MKCEEIRARLDLHALDALSPQERRDVEEHLNACDECRRQTAEWNNLVQDVRASLHAVRDTAPGSENMRQRIDAEIAAARKWRERSGMRLVWLRVAAGLLLVGGVAVMVSSWWKERRSGSEGIVVQWQRPMMSPASALHSHYPILCGRAVLTVERRKGELRAEDYVVAVDKRTGKPIWDVLFKTVAALHADGQRAYVITREPDGKSALVALDGNSGRQLWKSPGHDDLTRPGRHSLVVVGGGICWAEGSRISLLDLATGFGVWTKLLDERDVTLAAGPPNLIYVVAGSTLYAFRANDDGIAWQCQYGGQASPYSPTLLCADGGSVFVGQRDARQGGIVRCFGAESGDLRWTKETAAPVTLSAAGNRLYVRSSGVDVFNARTGDPLWSVSLQGCGPVASSEGRVYVVSGRAKQDILALDAANGKTIWTNHLAGSCSGIVVDADKGYICGHDGVLYAIAIGKKG